MSWFTGFVKKTRGRRLRISRGEATDARGTRLPGQTAMQGEINEVEMARRMNMNREVLDRMLDHGNAPATLELSLYGPIF